MIVKKISWIHIEMSDEKNFQWDLEILRESNNHIVNLMKLYVFKHCKAMNF